MVWTNYHANDKTFTVDPKLDQQIVITDKKEKITGFNHSRPWHLAIKEAYNS